MFGNIGVPQRLEFSVVGPAANEVARLEGLTKAAGRRTLASAEFVRHLPGEWESLGAQQLRGVGRHQARGVRPTLERDAKVLAPHGWRRPPSVGNPLPTGEV